MKHRVLILGATGIVGQYMMLNAPASVNWTGVSKTPGRSWDRQPSGKLVSCDLTQGVDAMLSLHDPDIVINLAGENRVDVVERDPGSAYSINITVPIAVGLWCERNRARYLHISSQGVFSGAAPPYKPADKPAPVNIYGQQKALAEQVVAVWNNSWIIARLTFVLGARLEPWGRRNPMEDMLEWDVKPQVSDRFFSPCFAEDAAEQLWKLALAPRHCEQKIYHVGIPIRTSRFEIARTLREVAHLSVASLWAARHDDFRGFAERPHDTSWAEGTSLYQSDLESSARSAVELWKEMSNVPV